MEDGEQFRIHFEDGSELKVDEADTSLQIYLGALSCYNNVTVQTDVETGEEMIFFSHHEDFTDLVAFVLENAGQVHLNLPKVPRGVRKAFNRSISQIVTQEAAELPEYFDPEDWLEQGDEDGWEGEDS